MKTTKLTLSLLMALNLTACLQGAGGGSSPTAAITLAPDTTTPDDEVIVPDPNQTTPLTYSDIESSTLSSAYGTISISGGILTDTYCGHSFPITSQSESNGVVTVSIDGWSGSHAATPGQGYLATGASWINPGHQDCQIDVLPLSWYYFGSGGTTKVYFSVNGTFNGQPASMEIAYRITYQFENVNDTITVNRTIKTRQYRRSQLNAYGGYTTVESSRVMSEMNYNQ